jgi:catechol-2,3-dioxygenase
VAGEQDPRPPVWIGHVVLETNRLAETEQFMRTIGMRSVVQRPEVAVLELRGGTHLVLTPRTGAVPGDAPFDLMVEDLEATHQRFVDLGLDPTPIGTASANHRTFSVREPAGNVITFFSNHVSGNPV